VDEESLQALRRRAQQREAGKTALMRYVRSRRTTGTRMAELQCVLPSWPRSRIQVLLRELVRDGKVHVHGRTKAARWYPGAAGGDCAQACPHGE